MTIDVILGYTAMTICIVALGTMLGLAAAEADRLSNELTACEIRSVLGLTFEGIENE